MTLIVEPYSSSINNLLHIPNKIFLFSVIAIASGSNAAKWSNLIYLYGVIFVEICSVWNDDDDGGGELKRWFGSICL